MSVFKSQGYFSITLDCGKDLSSASVRHILYQKPDGTKGFYETTLIGTSKLTYQFSNSDLDQAGAWQFQAYAVIGGRDAFGDIVSVVVSQSLKPDA